MFSNRQAYDKLRRLIQSIGIGFMRKLLIFGTITLLLGPGMRAQEPDNWWNERVFYEVFVRSFYDSDADGIGDLRGLTQQLDYLNDGDPTTSTDLGVTGIWLMPINEAYSYHGYDVTDYRAIEADYGTLDDFRAFLEAAHTRGIAVIIDLVMNHTSVEHPWFAQASNDPASATKDYFIWAEDHPGYQGPWDQPVWHPIDDRYYYGIFWQGMPDLNLTNPSVTEELYAIAHFWLEDVGVDGFRLDAAKHLIEVGEKQADTPATLAWLADFKTFVKQNWPDALIVGEIWSESTQIAPYVPASVDIAFEFDLAGTLIEAVQRRSDEGLITVQQQALELYPSGQYGAFLTNHDQARVMSTFLSDVEPAKVLATLLLTNPGVPFIYYGEEVGMPGNKPDELIRKPMQWTADRFHAGFSTVNAWQPPDGSVNRVNVAAQTDAPDSLLQHYRELIHLRNNSPALQTGDYLLVNSSMHQVYSFLRYTDDEILLILANLHQRPITNYELSLEAGPLDAEPDVEVLIGDAAMTAPEVNAIGGFANYVPLAELPPRSSFVLQFTHGG